MRAGMPKRCSHASYRCRAKPCYSSAMSALAAKNGRARSPAHKRRPSGTSAVQRSLGAHCSMRPAAIHYRRGAGSPGGGVQSSEIGPSPSPSTSVHRPMDSNSAIPSLCIFRPIWVGLGGLSSSRGTTCLCSFPPPTAQECKFLGTA